MVSVLGFGSSSSSSSSVSSRSSSPDVALAPSAAKEVNPLNPQGLKPCCACPETKSKRDDCFLKFPAEEATDQCKQLVQAHQACMRSYGFKV
ncbi:cytochrome C oxidase copper chaperone-domain-containing protein [Naematelia encephala]|uniref:Cytochrome C oxidase copper chaperone-domain-containing protein n=1 Tax=Naematelia encephala TaxID=71784 RepID=A0A1Y2ARQ9_9TREE|nr:cytochrome C oxidase copper chaperone-domain-containing protein [Naematelia encephala]